MEGILIHLVYAELKAACDYDIIQEKLSQFLTFQNLISSVSFVKSLIFLLLMRVYQSLGFIVWTLEGMQRRINSFPCQENILRVKVVYYASIGFLHRLNKAA